MTRTGANSYEFRKRASNTGPSNHTRQSNPLAYDLMTNCVWMEVMRQHIQDREQVPGSHKRQMSSHRGSNNRVCRRMGSDVSGEMRSYQRLATGCHRRPSYCNCSNSSDCCKLSHQSLRDSHHHVSSHTRPKLTWDKVGCLRKAPGNSILSTM